MESATGADVGSALPLQQLVPCLHSVPPQQQEQIGEVEGAPISGKDKMMEEHENDKEHVNEKKKKKKKKKETSKDIQGDNADGAVLPPSVQLQMAEADADAEGEGVPISEKDSEKMLKKKKKDRDNQGEDRGTTEQQRNKKKRKRMEVAVDDDNNTIPQNERKGKLCERVFSIQDEISILKGCVELTKQNLEPKASNLNVSLSVNPTLHQLTDKLSKLRCKYIAKARKGQTHFADDIDGQKYALCNTLWKHLVFGAGAGAGVGTSNATTCTCKCYEKEEINVTSLPQLIGILEQDGLCGALHSKLESKSNDELILCMESHMFRLISAQRHTAAFLAALKQN